MQVASSGIKTAWRNAACIMLFSGPFKYISKGIPATTRLTERLPVALEIEERSEDNAEILFVQRHSKSGFMANTHVFPGGVLDEADYSWKWMDLFTTTHTPHPFTSLLPLSHPTTSSSHTRLPIYTAVPSSSPIVGEVALRICAIREVFEETGVLLARDREEFGTKTSLLPGSFSPAVKVLPETTREEWRKRVCKDAGDFLTMCSELQCVPDIWSLIEWSDWLTPRNHHRRYDTVFYMSFINSKPPATPMAGEVTSVKWMSPLEADNLFISKEIILAPPQFAELKELQLYPSIPCLHSRALCRHAEKRTSARLLTKDNSMLSISNKDDLYPMEGSEDWTTPIQHPQAPHLREVVPLVLTQNTHYEYEIPSYTAQELHSLSKTTSRMEFTPPVNFHFIDSVKTSEIAEHVRRYGEEIARSKL